MSARPESPPLGALTDVLARHRLALFGLYVIVVAFCSAMVYGFSFVGGPAVLDFVVPGRELNSVVEWDGDYLAEALLFFVSLIGLQALFLFGGGRIPVKARSGSIWRTAVPIAVAGMAVVSMLVTFAFLLGEMFDRTNGDGSIRETALLDLELLETDSGILSWMVVMWLVWLAIAWVLFRKSDQETVLRCLTNGLLAGSWIEFLVALPVDIAIRQRADSCVCATGSWLALVVAIPVMVFAFGPAMYLLYLREVELGRATPGRAMRILVHKTRRPRTGGSEAGER